MKKSFAVLSVVVLLLTAAPLADLSAINWPGINSCLLFSTAKAADIVASGTCGVIDEENGLDGSQITWTLDSEGLLTISGTGKTADYKRAELDGEDGFPAPWKGKNINKVLILDGVSYIGYYAFDNCENLTEISLSASVEEITNRSIVDCAALRSINVAEENPFYLSENGILYSKDQKRLVKYPAGKTDVSYTVPDTVTDMEWYACEDNAYMQAVVFPEGITRIYGYAFSGCSELRSVSFPTGLTGILSGAFADCINLKDVEFPDSLKEIGYDSFRGCSSLQKVNIPKNVDEIMNNPFAECNELKEITVAKDNQRYRAEDGILYESSEGGLWIKTYPAGKTEEVYKMPISVTRAGLKAFEGCSFLKTIVIPTGKKVVPGGLITGLCELSSLEAVILPADVEEIQDAAVISDSLTDIYYEGSEQEWNNIIIADDYKDYLIYKSITIHYDYSGEKETVIIQIGDVDGDGKVSSADARLTLRASVGLEPTITVDSDAYKAADANGDNKVTPADARLILRASVGLEDTDEWRKKNQQSIGDTGQH